MKTLLLVAGRSRRFWPLSEKALFPLCGKPLLSHIIERLKEAGCADIIVVGGKHNLEEVRQLFPQLQTIEQEQLELGMRGALLSALPQIPGEDILLVSSNDVIEASAYRATVEAGQKADGAMLAQRVTRYFPGGYLSTDGDRITGIVEKPGAGNEPGDLVNIVCHYHSDPVALFQALQDSDTLRDDGYEQALAKLFPQKDYRAVPTDGFWQAVKYPWHLLALLPHMLASATEQQIHPTAQIHPSAVIEGNVTIGAEARVLPGACIRGPCVIGDRTIIGNNALVRGSSIGNDCVIGYCTEVTRSILADHVWTHSTYLGDSVIGENVSFGAGSVTGNLRLDEAEIASVVGGEKIPTGTTKLGAIIGNDVRIGIRTAFNPGVKIGSGTFVSSGCLVEHDLPEGVFARMKNGVLLTDPNTARAPRPEEREGYRRGV